MQSTRYRIDTEFVYDSDEIIADQIPALDDFELTVVYDATSGESCETQRTVEPDFFIVYYRHWVCLLGNPAAQLSDRRGDEYNPKGTESCRLG